MSPEKSLSGRHVNETPAFTPPFTIPDRATTRRLVRTFTVVILVFAVGANLTKGDQWHIYGSSQTVVFMMTYWMLGNIRSSVWSLRTLYLRATVRKRDPHAE